MRQVSHQLLIETGASGSTRSPARSSPGSRHRASSRAADAVRPPHLGLAADPGERRPARAGRSERLLPPPGERGPSLYSHNDEGPDDMPAHIRSALTATQLRSRSPAAAPTSAAGRGSTSTSTARAAASAASRCICWASEGRPPARRPPAARGSRAARSGRARSGRPGNGPRPRPTPRARGRGRAQGLEPGGEVDRRADGGEVEPGRAADVAVSTSPRCSAMP